MTAHTRLSAKGQIVIPKDVRDRLGWTQGSDLEVVETAGGVLLRRPPGRGKLSVLEAAEQLRTRFQYTGPPIPVERLSWSAEVDDEFERSRK